MLKTKKSIITKTVADYAINKDIIKTHSPKAGDVALFEVLEIGKHKAIQSEFGTNHYIFEGDNILCAFGSRYATEQFEGYVPQSYKESYEIIGQGGVVGELASMHDKFEDIGATTVKLLGYAVDEQGQVINTIDTYEARSPKSEDFHTDSKVFLSVGSSMDSGKTTTAAFFSRGAALLGKNVGYIKLTGTVYAKDCSFVRDCGAVTAVDFSYCGYPSTYEVPLPEIKKILYTLLERVSRKELDYIIVEIADGLYQQETEGLLSDPEFLGLVTGGILLSCGSSLAIKQGVSFLKERSMPPVALSGVFTASPLLIKEVCRITDAPVYTLEDFLDEHKMKVLLS